MRKETYESEAPLKIKFDLRTYILENPASVIHFSSVLHHTITNHADLIPKNIFEKCLSNLPRKEKYFLIKNAYGNVLLVAESALHKTDIKVCERPWRPISEYLKTWQGSTDFDIEMQGF